MANLTDNHTGIPFATIQLQDALNKIKKDIENAIVTNGEEGKNALIRSQRPIKLIHDVVKTAFYNAGVHPTLINPELKRLQKVANQSTKNNNKAIVLKDKELSLSGYLKNKNQDVSIIPDNILVSPEVLTFPTYLNGFTDKYGSLFTESVLSVNVRSQLSSVSKNFDTLYERTFAESLNFHLRFPSMVLGEVYMIVLKEYDSQAATINKIEFKKSEYIEKYILAFQALNDRIDVHDPLYKYERIALLIVDFSKTIPKLYNTTQELIDDGLLKEDSTANIDNLSFPTFVDDLLRIYRARFPRNSFN